MTRIRKSDGWCVPAALQYLSGLDDRSVLEVCEFNGFHPSHGMEEFEYIESAKELGVELKRINLKKTGLYGVCLGEFLKYNQTGKYLIYTFLHVFVIDRGRIIDPLNGGSLGLKRKVTAAWRVS